MSRFQRQPCSDMIRVILMQWNSLSFSILWLSITLETVNYWLIDFCKRLLDAAFTVSSEQIVMMMIVPLTTVSRFSSAIAVFVGNLFIKSTTAFLSVFVLRPFHNWSIASAVLLNIFFVFSCYSVFFKKSWSIFWVLTLMYASQHS